MEGIVDGTHSFLLVEPPSDQALFLVLGMQAFVTETEVMCLWSWAVPGGGEDSSQGS